MRQQALDAYVDILPHDDDALHAYIEAYYGYRIARKAVCPGHVAPFDGIADLFFMRNPELDHIWVGGRGVGKTLNLSIIEHLLLRFFGDTIANIGAVETQALKLYSYIERHSTLPRFIKDLAKRPLLSKTYFKNGGFIEVMPATMSRVNSPHSRLTALDETDLFDQKILDEAQCLDGASVVACEDGSKAIRDVRAGERVWAYSDGAFTLNRVLQTHVNGVRSTINIALSNGRTITCTPDHPILTESGYKEAGSLRPTTRLVPYVQKADVGEKNAVLSRAHAATSTQTLLPNVWRRSVRQAQPFLPGSFAVKGRSSKNGLTRQSSCVSDLQQADDAGVKALHGVLSPLDALGRSAASGAEENISVRLLNMWRQAQSIGCSLRHMLSAGRTWAGTQKRTRINAMRCGSCAREAWAGIQAGIKGRRSFSGAWNSDNATGRYWQIQCRFLAHVNSHYCRSVRLGPSNNAGCNRERYYTRAISSDARVSVADPARHRNTMVGSADNGDVRVLSITAGPRVPVYDITVEHAHNFVAEGVVVHNSIPIRHNNRPPQMVFTSSLKFAYGPMVRLMDEAAERGRKPYTFCVFEVIETCPVTRHRDGAGCVTCPLAKECLDEKVDPLTGRTTQLAGPGRAARADGFMTIPDVIKMYQSLDSDTWDSQWRCKRPSSKGLVYPQFGEHHVIDYMGKGDPIVGRYNPALPVFAGVDFGFANATAVIYVQVTPDHRIVAFAEDFVERRISEDTAAAIKAMPWFDNLGWIVGDPAALDARMTLQRHGVKIGPADNSKALHKADSGIGKIRWALAPQGGIAPFAFVDRSCKNLLREIRSYHNPEHRNDANTDERPVKSDDHAVDAWRYALAKIIRRTG